MSPQQPRERQFLSPIDPNWTFSDLLDWIGADDARCHDERLQGLLNVVERALGFDSARASSTVALVRSIAARLAAEPALQDRRLDELCNTTQDGDLGVGGVSGAVPAPLDAVEEARYELERRRGEYVAMIAPTAPVTVSST